MTWFRVSVDSTATVDAPRERIWEVLTDPVALAELTPFLQHIDVDGDLWRWQMTKVPVLSTSIKPEFTERMSFTEPTRIEYAHEPPAGADERAGVEGTYVLEDAGGGRTKLSISLGVEADLPLPKAAGPAVRAAMKSVIAGMGRKFSKNLLRRLGA